MADGVAVGWTYPEIVGQQVVGSNETIALRKNHSPAVLAKQNDSWFITAQMFMDENRIE